MYFKVVGLCIWWVSLPLESLHHHLKPTVSDEWGECTKAELNCPFKWAECAECAESSAGVGSGESWSWPPDSDSDLCSQDSLSGSGTENWPLHIRLEEEEKRAWPGPGREEAQETAMSLDFCTFVQFSCEWFLDNIDHLQTPYATLLDVRVLACPEHWIRKHRAAVNVLVLHLYFIGNIKRKIRQLCVDRGRSLTVHCSFALIQ